ncbi:MAG TPA: TonB family protein [Mucilaginibacter sp.]
MRLLTFTIILICYLGVAFAQQNQTSKILAVSFIKKDGGYTSSRDSAEYIRIISEPDSGSTLFNASEIYKNGKQKFLGKSSKRNYISSEGQCITYYPSGIKKSVENYKDGKPIGLCYFFYPNGKIYHSKEFQESAPVGESIQGDLNFTYLIKDCRDSTGKVLVQNGNGHFVGYDDAFKTIEEEGTVKAGNRDSIWTGQDKGLKIQFTEQYNAGKLISGTSTDSAGVKHTYDVRMIEPQYKGGISALYKYLGNNIIYPENARKNDIEGTVMLLFVVKKDGSLKDIKVVRSADKELDTEAVRVLSRSRGWKPGMYYGIPVNVKYQLPITFALK